MKSTCMVDAYVCVGLRVIEYSDTVMKFVIKNRACHEVDFLLSCSAYQDRLVSPCSIQD